MFIKTHFSISTKFVAALLFPLIAGMTLSLVGIAHFVESRTEQSAVLAAQDAAQAMSNELRVDFEESMAATRTLRDSLVALRELKQLSRPAVTALMQKTLEDNPRIFGIWSCWETDALDGLDQSGSAGQPLGRYAKYVVRHADGIRQEPLEGFEGPEPLAYYGLPKRNKVESVVEPYGYQADGHWSLLTTFSEPIIIDGQFLGAIGSDIALDELQKIASERHPLGTGRVSLITDKGLWLSDIRADQIGKPVDATDPALAKIAALASSGSLSIQRGHSTFDNENEVLRVFVPLHVGRSATSWLVMVTLPVASVFGQARELVGIIAAAGALLVLIVCGIVLWTTRQLIGKPLKIVAAQLKQADEPGAMSPAARRLQSRRDEIGVMAAAVHAFQDSALRTRALEKAQSNERSQRIVDDERLRRESEQKAAEAAAQIVVQSIGTGLERLAAGDLTYRLDVALPGVYEPLRLNLNVAVSKLQALVTGIAINASNIRAGTESIARSADDLSKRTERQAASLEETVATLEKITATVRATADNAKQMHDVTSSSRKDAGEAGVVVGQAIDAMAAIEMSSQQIGQIIGVIDEIAFQTNLLALNAGVEAARAGDSGRGFAVVASEVRSLAQRSAEAAKEIKVLISASALQVGAGVQLVKNTGDALSRIVAKVGEITTVVAEIADSASEQAAALQQVNAAMNLVDNVTQENASMVDQSRSASHSLVKETEDLFSRTNSFKLGRTQEQARSSAIPLRRVSQAA